MAEPALTSALRSLVDRSFIGTVKYNEQQMKANRIGAHPQILDFEKKAIARLRGLNIPFYAHSMIRTAAEQDALFVRNVTKARAGESPHNWGCAVDLVSSIHHWDISTEAWIMIGHTLKELAIQKGLKVEWGGDWKRKPSDKLGWDPAHWQIANWKNLKGEYPWPPPLTSNQNPAARKLPDPTSRTG